MSRNWLACAVALFAALAAHAALADPRLDEVVYSPYVENHEFELETRYAQESGGPLGGADTLVLETEYGFTDRFSLALVSALTRQPGEQSRFTKVGLEGVSYLGAIPNLGVDAALYLEYAKGLNGQTDGAEAKLLLAKTSGRFQGLFNFIVERPFSGPRDEQFAAYGYAASATWRAVGNLRLGLEAFGDLGDDHGFLTRSEGAYVGPQLKWEGRPTGSPVEIDVDAGWLAAVGANQREGRGQARLAVELEHVF
ncbi:MAG: hypothetical protein ACHP84_19765 [Caulobacterales bacterium]